MPQILILLGLHILKKRKLIGTLSRIFFWTTCQYTAKYSDLLIAYDLQLVKNI